MIVQKIQKSSNVVVNIEEWESVPANNSTYLFTSHPTAGIGWKLEDDILVPPVSSEITVDEYKEKVLSEIRNIRYNKEVGGILFNNSIPIRTDEKSQSKLQGAIALFNLDPNLASVEWEAVPGTFATLTKQNMVDIGVAVGAHIQACFSRSKALTLAVQACTTKAQVDAIDINSGWPGV